MGLRQLAVVVGFHVLAGHVYAACPAAPHPACRTAEKSQLRVVATGEAAKNRLVWQWRRGSSTSLADLGDPRLATSYALCAYDASGRVVDVTIPAAGTCAGASCWTAISTKGFRFKDRAAATSGLARVLLLGSSTGQSKIKIVGRGGTLPAPTLPLASPITIQLQPIGSAVCFETIFPTSDVARATSTEVSAKQTLGPTTPVPPLASAQCGQPLSAYPQGTSTDDSLVHDGIARTFRVYVPPSYDASGATPAPLFVLLHGGFGSGAQIEANARITAVADAEGFVVVSPTGYAGVLGIPAWNAGDCCGEAMLAGIDDVGFIADVIDHLEARLCLDRRRVYAAGISNGGLLSHRLACTLSTRIRAIGPVSGTIALSPCAPIRPVPVMSVHGTDDSFVPFAGGVGCGPSGFAFASVPDTVAGWRARDGCSGPTVLDFALGDGTCTRFGTCEGGADVELCSVAGGGHVWPGGTPPVLPGFGSCLFGYQSQSFFATQVLWNFFAQHPPR